MECSPSSAPFWHVIGRVKEIGLFFFIDRGIAGHEFWFIGKFRWCGWPWQLSACWLGHLYCFHGIDTATFIYHAGLNCWGQWCGIICGWYWGYDRVKGVISVVELLRFPGANIGHVLDGKSLILITGPVLEAEQYCSYFDGDDGVIVIMELDRLCPLFSIHAAVLHSNQVNWHTRFPGLEFGA